jgi:hypothetical protein
VLLECDNDNLAGVRDACTSFTIYQRPQLAILSISPHAEERKTYWPAYEYDQSSQKYDLAAHQAALPLKPRRQWALVMEERRRTFVPGEITCSWE